MVIDFAQNINLKSLSPQTEFEEKVISFLADWFSDSAAVSVQTSGSTGIPKIFEIEKQRMRSSARMTCNFLNLKEGDTALLCLPVEYISGKMMIVRAVVRKLKLFIKSPSSKPIEDLDQTFDFCAMSPLQVENSLEKIHFIKNLIIGGAQVSESLKTKIHTQLSSGIPHPAPSTRHPTSRIYETYGMSETLSHIGLKQIYPVSEDCFSVFDGIEIALDERGCLKISAPALNPEILQTNDLAELRGDKEFRFTGRIDHVINSAGLKINPEQLERVVKKHLQNELVFLGIKDERLGQKLILVIEGTQNNDLQSKLNAAFGEIEKSFSKNHLPKEIRFLHPFPRIANGKINRQDLLLLF